MDSRSRFDEQYRTLRDNDAPGWGGDRYARRERGWKEMLHRLDTVQGLPPQGARVLELGSGSGMVTRMLVERGYEVEGIELSETAVAWAIEQGDSRARHHVGNATDLGRWRSDSQDLVVDANCLHCILGEDRARCLAEVHRVLAPTGSLLVSSMVGPPGALTESLRHEAGQLLQDGEPVRTLLAPNALRDELACAGFEVVFEHLAENAWWSHLTLLLRKDR